MYIHPEQSALVSFIQLNIAALQSPASISETYIISSLSDCSVLVEMGNRIDPAVNSQVLQLNSALLQNPFAGFIESVPAYSSLAVFYDVVQVKRYAPATAFEYVKDYLCGISHQAFAGEEKVARVVEIPVCYEPEFGPDIESVAALHHLGVDEVIRLHTSVIYRVYMMGFLPGFAYMGTLPLSLHTSRKEAPRLHVPAGSVGIAGAQTGIYPVTSPGGWQLVGRTPLSMFDATKEQPCFLAAGDRVQFVPITKIIFEQYHRHANP